jgi:hypothetical protein
MHTIRGSAEHFLDIVMTAVGAGGDETAAMTRWLAASTARRGLETARAANGVMASSIPGAPHTS